MKKIFLVFAFVASVFSAWAGSHVKTDIRNALVMAYSPENSVYEDENIKLEIYGERLWATNKTNRTIFIDLSQCFLIHNGSSYPMFDKHQDGDKASKKKITTSVEEFISIAPSAGGNQNETFICNLAGGLYGEYTTSESPSGNFSEHEERLLTVLNELVSESLRADPKGKQYLGTAYRHLAENESINNIGASVAYAFNKRSENWTPISISTWVCDVYLAPYYVEMPTELTKKDKRGFGVKKTESAVVHIKADSPFEFDQDKSPVIVCDWVGNFKKGTFELKTTRVSKKQGGSLFVAALATVLTGGATAYLFANLDETYYKSIINFDGENDYWGEMSYMESYDLSKFKIKR